MNGVILNRLLWIGAAESSELVIHCLTNLPPTVATMARRYVQERVDDECTECTRKDRWQRPNRQHEGEHTESDCRNNDGPRDPMSHILVLYHGARRASHFRTPSSR